jgi:hypothetical protein
MVDARVATAEQGDFEKQLEEDHRRETRWQGDAR